MLNFFCPISYSKEFKKIFSIKKFPIFMGASKKSHNYEYESLNWWINKKSGNIQIYPKVSLDKLYFKSHGSGTVGKTWKDHHKLFFQLANKYLKGNICEIGGGNNSILNKSDQEISPGRISKFLFLFLNIFERRVYTASICNKIK